MEEEKQSLRFSSETPSTHSVLLDYLPNNSSISSFREEYISSSPPDKCLPILVDVIPDFE